MTDNYGADSNRENGHDEVLMPEQDAVREPPSDYEFADEHGASAAEEQTEETSGATAEIKPAGRSPLMPIAAAVGVLLLGGAAWWQFGRGVAPSQPVSSAMPNMMSPASLAPQVRPAEPTTNSAMLAPAPASSSLPNLTAGAPPAAAPAVAAPAVSAPVGVPTPVVSAPMVAQPVMAPASAPAMPAAAMPVAAMPVAVQATIPAAVPALSHGASETSDQRIQTLSARVDSLQSSLDQANQQLGQITNMVANTANAGPTVKELQDRIDKLEQDLAQRSAAPSLVPPRSAPGEAVVVSPSVSHKKTPHHTETVKVVSHKEPKKKPAPEANVQTSWVLRGASPGQAWVAASPTSRDLKQVQVGDMFEGIGKVTSIEQQNGSWVVTGTKGQIQ